MLRRCLAVWTVVAVGCASESPDKTDGGDASGTSAQVDSGSPDGDTDDPDCGEFRVPDGAGGCEDIDECAEDNGGCGDPVYWDCANVDGAPPECTDVDECAVDNGGCGDPAVFSCTNVEGAAALCDYDWAADWSMLMDGVGTAESGGSLPSRLVVWGETAFPLIHDDNERVWAAAARAGAGKVLHFGHETHLGGAMSAGDSGLLVDNAVEWMLPDGGVVLVDSGLDTMADRLAGLGLTVQRRSGAPDPAAWVAAGVQLWVTTTYDDHDADTDASIRDWIEAGGSVMSGGHAWWWAYSTGGTDPYHDHPGNQWLGVSGITLSGSTADSAGTDVIAGLPSELLHATWALDAAAGHIDGTALLDDEDAVRAADAAGFAASVLPIDSEWFAGAQAVLDSVPPVVPTEAAPVRPASQPVEALAVRVRDALNARTPLVDLEVDPAGADFPGTSSGTASTWSVEVDVSYGGRDSRYMYSGAGAPIWRALGVWIPAGHVVSVTVPPSLVDSGVDLQVGSHTDTLWHKEEWTRSPSVVRRFDVDDTRVDVGSALGGLLYLRVPAGVALGTVTVSGDGGLPAPRFVAGETDAADWAAAVSSTTVPWAELETDHLVLTVPTSSVAGLADPTALMAFWQDVMDAQSTLAAIETRARAERIVTDRQISAGWMHSGYPIMAHNASAPDLTDLDQLETSGDWGAFHELGHNHQWSAWFLNGATEGTVNLWSVYTMEEVVGIDRGSAHPAMADSDRQSRVDSYLAGGADFAGSWSVWTALETYVQLEEAFGWEPLITVQAQYLADSTADDPSDQAAVIDKWVRRTSEATGRDLGAFYLAWGWPVSADTLAAIDHLPDWTDHPMQ